MNSNTPPRRRLFQTLGLLGLAVLAFLLWKPLGPGSPASR